MRLALISDIHGNHTSLQAVLDDINREKVDQIICLGDVATLGPQPREVLECLMSFNCTCIMGNHDAFLLEPALLHTYMDFPWFADVVDWTIAQLSAEQLDYVRSFKPSLKLPLCHGQNLLCFHGSPHSYFDLILATTPADKLDEMLGEERATIMAGGHSHVQMVRQHRGVWLLNVGSVGMPFEEMPFVDSPRILPWAEYAIITVENGRFRIDTRRIPVNARAIKQAAYNSKLPHPHEWAENWLVEWNPND
ncbi:MAG: metallophosphoesterase family protein [Chloroflexota bacterium]